MPHVYPPNSTTAKNRDTNMGRPVLKKSAAPILVAFVVFLLVSLPAHAWWNPSWNARARLAFDNSLQTQNLDDFPVLVVLNPGNIDYGRTEPNGEDLRFIDADDSTVLKHEIEKWTPGGTSYVWVRVPRIDGSSPSDFIYLYYDSAGAPDIQDPAGVWAVGYLAVWHLDDDPSGASSVLDSTVNVKHGSGSASMNATNVVAGQIGLATTFDGSADYIRVPSGAGDVLEINGNNLTIESWVRRNGSTPGTLWMSFLGRQFGTASTPDAYAQVLHRLDPSQAVAIMAGANATSSTGAVPDLTWRYLVATKDASFLTQYVSGAQDGQSASGGPVVSDPNDVTIGAMENDATANPSEWYIGDLDEIRISDVTRSADWIAAQHLSMTDNFVTFTAEISGTVFEDVNYGGGAGRDQATSSGVVRPGARVELYDAAGVYVSFTTTNATGDYSFAGLSPGDYTVRVANASVTSSRAGYVPGLLSVQTYRTDASSGTAVSVTNRVGGQDPSVADAGNGSVGATMNTTTGVFTAVVTGTAQSITNVTLSVADITGVDYGYNFDTVVNTNDVGQGSLRQFILNANALDNTGLAQVGQTAGREVSIFMIPVAQLTSGIAIIAPTTLLPTISGVNAADTSIDGTTQTTNIGNTNLGISGTGFLGAGGTVGLGADGIAGTADEPALSQVEAPEVEIKNGTNVRTGLDVQTNSITIRGIAIHGFGQNLDADIDGNIRVGLDGTTDFTGTLIEKNIIGATAFNFVSPPVVTDGDGLIVRGADGGILRTNLIGYNYRSGIKTHDDVNGWLIEDNEIRSNGTTTRYGDAIDLGYITGTTTISKNLLINNGASGVDSYESNGSHTVTNNTIISNGFAGQLNQETSGVRLFGTDSNVTLNLIQNNFGAGVLIVGDGAAFNQPALRNRISLNSFSGNGSNAIDLLAVGGDDNFGDGITLNGGAPNACSYLVSTGNDGIDYPVILSADLSGGTTTIIGQACPNSDIEVYRALAGAGDTNAGTDYGEGERYLGSTTTDGAGDFTFMTTVLAGGDVVSAIVIDANDNTSEFGPNITVAASVSGTVYEDVNGDAGLGDAVGAGGVRVRLYTDVNDDGTVDAGDAFVDETTTNASGVYSFAVDPGVTGDRYLVAVDSKTVPPNGGSPFNAGFGQGDVWAEQTYGDDPTTPAVDLGARFGGGTAGVSDDVDPVLTAPASNVYQHLGRVNLGLGPGTGIDFALSFQFVSHNGDVDDDAGANRTAQGTLRQLIQNANAIVGNPTLNIPADTYVLAIAGTLENDSRTGDLDVTDAVTLVGAGMTSTFIDANFIDRVFELFAGTMLTDMTIRNGDDLIDGGPGGGVWNRSGAGATLTRVALRNNKGNNGGGIMNAAALIMTDVEISGGTATSDGGGIFNTATIVWNRGTLSGNAANNGGGLLNNGPAGISATLTNVTISGNSTPGNGGGINTSRGVDLIHATVYGNSATQGAGVHTQGGGSVRFTNSVVANHSPASLACGSSNTITLGGNVESTGNSCEFTDPSDQHSVTATDLKMGPLANNGGPTQTHALNTGSFAVDAAIGCPPPATDQRGTARPDGAACDSGAFEGAVPLATISGSVYHDINNNGNFDAGELGVGDVWVKLVVGGSVDQV
ncbi:MAG: DUF2341 domain-containing protein, partial [Gammaproteobacteria bacterium]|nr:DUF2341 domain-containing protein [Gammaproteobacteria bacterium]